MFNETKEALVEGDTNWVLNLRSYLTI